MFVILLQYKIMLLKNNYNLLTLANPQFNDLYIRLE